MKCCFCSQEIEASDEATDQGWIPNFWHNDAEYAGPICPDCRRNHLVKDEHGEHLLRSVCSVPPTAIRMPETPPRPKCYRHSNQKFPLGQVVATPASLRAIDDAGQMPEFFLDKHSQGDWGEVCAEDGRLNDQALVDGSRLLSAYRTLRGARIWVITEATDDEGKRVATTLLLPSEY